MTPETPKFLTIEGGEGVGKTTQTKRLAAYMTDRLFLPLYCTFLPGATNIGPAIRQLLIDFAGTADLCAEAQEFLLCANHAQLSLEMQRCLDNEQWGLCDRSLHTGFVYSTYGKKNDPRWEVFHSIAYRAGIKPHHVVLLVMNDLDEAIRRGKIKRPGAMEVFDNKEREFHENVRKGFNTHADRNPHMFTSITVDGLTEEQVTAKIIDRLEERKIIPERKYR